MDPVGASIRLNDEADMDRDVERTDKDRAVAANVIGQRLASLGPEGLSPEDGGLTGVAGSVEAVAASVRESGDPCVAVIPEGPYVVPGTLG